MHLFCTPTIREQYYSHGNTEVPLQVHVRTPLYTPTIRKRLLSQERGHPTQKHVQHHSYTPTIRKHSYNHTTQTSCSGTCTTPLHSYNQTEKTSTITQHRHPAQEHVQHHSYNQKTLLQSQNIVILLRSTYNTTPTNTKHYYRVHGSYIQRTTPGT